MGMRIRKAKLEDVQELMQLFEAAVVFMRENGNLNQWRKGYPSVAMIEEDIKQGKSYCCTVEGQIVGTFYFAIEEEANYQQIYEGNWLNSDSMDYPIGIRI